jgi:hypothetical protein
MSDSHRRYNAINKALVQCYGNQLRGHVLRHFNTLALLICGIVGAGHTHLSEVATHSPEKTKVESRVKKFKRWLMNGKVSQEVYWQPFAKGLVAKLAQHKNEVTLVIDGSTMGRHCVGLVVGIVYAGRALPLGWLVRKGAKGHFAQTDHLALLSQVKPLVPAGTKVIFLGDGEFDGTLLQAELAWSHWHYVVRTACNSRLRVGQEWYSMADLGVRRGGLEWRNGVGFSSEGYGSLLALAYWDKQYEEPIYLISNLACPHQAIDYYKRRWRIETFFSDQKSRGFRLTESHLDRPALLERLFIALALAYWWLTYLGVVARQRDEDQIVHRTERCDLSFFKLGWRYLGELLNRSRKIPVDLLALPASAFF